MCWCNGTSRVIVIELEQAIDKAVRSSWLAVTQASTAPCNKLVCVTGNDVFVSFPTGFGKSCRGLRAFESSRQALQVSSIRQKSRKSMCVRARALVL